MTYMFILKCALKLVLKKYPTKFLSKKPRRRLENVLKYILQNKETEGTD